MHRRLAVLPLLLAGAFASCSGNENPSTAASQLAFGTSMAQRGLWDEALFRFREAERIDPDNPRVQNNLGVAYEATGEFEMALQHYQKAIRLAPEDRGVKNNYARFVEFYQSFRPKQAKEQGLPTIAKPKSPAEQPPDAGDTAQNGRGAGIPPATPGTPIDDPGSEPPGVDPFPPPTP